MLVLGSCFGYACFHFGGAMIAGRPFAKIGEERVEGIGLFGRKALDWADVVEAEVSGGLLGPSEIRVRGRDRAPWERRLRLATLGLAGNWLSIPCLFLKEPGAQVVAAFNRHCPGHLKL